MQVDFKIFLSIGHTFKPAKRVPASSQNRNFAFNIILKAKFDNISIKGTSFSSTLKYYRHLIRCPRLSVLVYANSEVTYARGDYDHY